MLIDGHESKLQFFKKILFNKFKDNTLLHNVLIDLVNSMSLYPSFRQLSKPAILQIQRHFSTEENRSKTLILLPQPKTTRTLKDHCKLYT